MRRMDGLRDFGTWGQIEYDKPQVRSFSQFWIHDGISGGTATIPLSELDALIAELLELRDELKAVSR